MQNLPAVKKAAGGVDSACLYRMPCVCRMRSMLRPCLARCKPRKCGALQSGALHPSWLPPPMMRLWPPLIRDTRAMCVAPLLLRMDSSAAGRIPISPLSSPVDSRTPNAPLRAKPRVLCILCSPPVHPLQPGQSGCGPHPQLPGACGQLHPLGALSWVFCQPCLGFFFACNHFAAALAGPHPH